MDYCCFFLCHIAVSSAFQWFDYRGSDEILPASVFTVDPPPARVAIRNRPTETRSAPKVKNNY